MIKFICDWLTEMTDRRENKKIEEAKIKEKLSMLDRASKFKIQFPDSVSTMGFKVTRETLKDISVGDVFYRMVYFGNYEDESEFSSLDYGYVSKVRVNSIEVFVISKHVTRDIDITEDGLFHLSHAGGSTNFIKVIPLK